LFNKRCLNTIIIIIIKLFSDVIHMKFGIEKCATALRGKPTICGDLEVSEDTVISAMNVYDSYKYLGLFELDQFNEKHIIIAKYCKRIWTLLKSALNGRNLISTINMYAHVILLEY